MWNSSTCSVSHDIAGGRWPQALTIFLGSAWWRPGLKVWNSPFGPKTLEDLDKALAVVAEQSSHCKNTRVKDGAWVVGRFIRSKESLRQHDIKARTHGGRVFWGRFWGTKKGSLDNQCSANFMSNRGTMPDKEVLATLSQLQYQECQRSF